MKGPNKFPVEALLFVVFAAVIWFVSTVVNTNISRQYNVELVAVGGALDPLFLIDSTKTTTVEIEASGLDALMLSKYKGAALEFNAADWMHSGVHGAFLLPRDIQGIVLENVGNSYTIRPSKNDTLWFQAEPYVEKLVPVHLSHLERIQLPLGWRWIHRPTLRPDSVLLRGPEHLISEWDDIEIDAPEIQMGAALSLKVDLPTMDKLIEISNLRLTLEAEADQWTDHRLLVQTVIDQEVFDVELWVSGPKNLMGEDPDALVQFHWNTIGEDHVLDVSSKSDMVHILDFQPRLKIPMHP